MNVLVSILTLDGFLYTYQVIDRKLLTSNGMVWVGSFSHQVSCLSWISVKIGATKATSDAIGGVRFGKRERRLWGPRPLAEERIAKRTTTEQSLELEEASILTVIYDK